ncbi:hypothetical protein [Sinanaerobacter chloroacetimidivorans]|uniref:Uncharacterized protein n=1 Tax=Sinanaerobacter chloroacetimidivorans TaxID=2818044 RepID=A0A8J8B1G5_9FIRM|nr:hypothetical protein [Sinanaerobacter chloroacetimidivorans]MBR0597641.1 hypothetical protein [Sinanaerobacter chloroacetimidivorans]
MHLMKLDVASLEHLRKATESKEVTLDNPIIVKTKDMQFPLVLDKGEYSDYITPFPVKFSLDEVEEIYLVIDFQSAKVHDLLIHTEKYDVVEFDLTCFDALIDSM